MFPLFDPVPRPVVGYHGTTADIASRILTGTEVLKKSDDQHHWLGSGGTYFYQDGPGLAHRWAKWKARHDPSIECRIVGATIRLENCLDLMDIRWWGIIRDAYEDLLAQCARNGIDVPTQIERQLYEDRWSYRDKDGHSPTGQEEIGKTWLDCAIIDLVRKNISDSEHENIKVIRSVFADGRRVFRRSNFFDTNRVEIMVVDQEVVERVWDATAQF